MTSVVTAVPPVFTEWCIATPWFPTWNRTDKYHCGNSSRGFPEEDYQSICCPGTITDLKFPIFKQVLDGTNRNLNIDDLVCCPGAPGLADATTCSSSGPGAEPTPLASYAATNVDKAELFEATYPLGTQGAGASTNVLIMTQLPYCIWMYTGNGTRMSTISLAAPVFTTTLTPLGGWWGDDGTTSSVSSFAPKSTSSASSLSLPSSGESASKTASLTISAPLRASSSTLAAATTTTTSSSASRGGRIWNGWTVSFLAGVATAALVA